jgi:hypothetical protein
MSLKFSNSVTVFVFISFVNALIFKQCQRSESSCPVVFRDKKCRFKSLKFFQLRYGDGNTFLLMRILMASSIDNCIDHK